jgi:hypothetical protein
MKKTTFRDFAAIPCPHAGSACSACMTNVLPLPLMSTTCVGRSLAPTLPISLTKPQGPVLGHFGFLGDVMSVILKFARKWVRWYRVLRYHKAFSFADSVRFGLWLSLS